MKEATDDKFLDVIDSLRELRKKYTIPGIGALGLKEPNSVNSRLGCESTKSNRNLKSEIEFESAIVELINAYNKVTALNE